MLSYYMFVEGALYHCVTLTNYYLLWDYTFVLMCTVYS